jgi:MinD-like ATPase involved in chromosome partitioning or flagellar assembly
VAVFLVGVERSGQEHESLGRLEKAAARQLGLEVEEVGSVVRDAASYRALLLETPVVQLEPDAASSQSLREIARRVLRTPAATH